MARLSPSSAEKPSDRIGERVAFYRKLNGMSAADLSEATGGAVSKGVIANIETGRKKDLTVDELVYLSWALCVPPLAIALPIDSPDGFVVVASEEADTTLVRVDIVAREFVQPAIPAKAAREYPRPGGPARALAASLANTMFQRTLAIENLSRQKRKLREARSGGNPAEIRVQEAILADAERTIEQLEQQFRSLGMNQTKNG